MWTVHFLIIENIATVLKAHWATLVHINVETISLWLANAYCIKILVSFLTNARLCYSAKYDYCLFT